MKQEELNEVLRKHQLWLDNKEGGEKANLKGAELRGLNLQGADLRWANLQGADLREADLRWKNLSCVNLIGAILRGSDLRGVNLQGASLREASLERTNLREADLRGANLRDANLKYAELEGVNLQAADLRLANLREACLEGAKLEGVNLGFSPNFADTKGNQPVYQASCGFGSRNSTLTLLALGEEKDWQFFTGCFKGNKEELVAAVAEKYKGVDRENYMRTLNYLWETAQAHHSQGHGKLYK